MSGESGRKSVIVGVVFLSIAVGIIIYSYASQRTARRTEPSSADSATASGGSPSSSDSVEPTTAGQSNGKTGIPGERKAGGKESVAAADVGEKTDDPFDYGRTPVVKGDVNSQVVSAVEAVKTKSHPERLSVMLNPKPFNVEEYQRNAKAYLDVVEPGRVYQPKQPGPDVPRIQSVGPTRIKMKQGESTVLQVRVTPGMPCTFTSFDLGRFENELTSITVAAGENGVAETRFFATSGTIEDVHILCASPVASGQLRYVVTVSK